MKKLPAAALVLGLGALVVALTPWLWTGLRRYRGRGRARQGGLMDPTGSDESVVDRLAPFTWDNDESVGYEITIEAINEVIGLYVAKSHAEEARADHDHEALDAWAGERRKWHAVRQGLNPADRERMQQVREECRELSAQLRAG